MGESWCRDDPPLRVGSAVVGARRTVLTLRFFSILAVYPQLGNRWAALGNLVKADDTLAGVAGLVA